VDAVVLPHAGPGAIPREGTSGKHLDGSDARVHYPGLLIVDAIGNERKRIEPLRGQVLISAQRGSGKPPVSNFAAVVGLDRVNNNGSASDLELIPAFTDFTRVAVAISFIGGKMDREKNSSLRWTVDPRFNPGHPHKNQKLVLTQIWRSNKPVTIQIVDPGGTTTTEALAADEDAYIYNFDTSMPDVLDLDDAEKCTKGTALDDVDFNWLYQLVAPKVGTLTVRMGGLPLPRPYSQCPRTGRRTPRTSTCFGGGWGG